MNGAWTRGLFALGAGGDRELDFACRDAALQLVEYTVGCALRADQQVAARVGDDVVTIEGKLGLAPEWADGPCDEACRGWVSACLIASINAKGEKVAIALDGEHPAFGMEPVPGFTMAEATFYGNVIADPPELHACLADGVSQLTRSCGDRSDCAISVAGRCSDVCEDLGCRDATGVVYEHTIDTYLRE